MRIPTRLDRYPAKMVSHLADRLVERYAIGGDRLLDPFFGSGAILLAAQRRGLHVSGVDVNPLASLFACVKLHGFCAEVAGKKMELWVKEAEKCKSVYPISWENKDYWFTSGTLAKFERLRFAYRKLGFGQDPEGMAILLAFTLAIRLCSRADQRSPKPFISKSARKCRGGKHYDPYQMMTGVLSDLSRRYGKQQSRGDVRLARGDVAVDGTVCRRLGMHSHVITSPPYINAQDYFRNFKLELYLLEGILDFSVKDIRDRFIGTERGVLLNGISERTLDEHRALVDGLGMLETNRPRLASVVHRYFYDMGCAFDSIKAALKPRARLVLVCGDNLVGGLKIRTWQILEHFLAERGFRFVERFADTIGDRMLPPKRSGHKGLIKEEIVSAFEMR